MSDYENYKPEDAQLQILDAGGMEQAEFDTAVATAKKFPRNVINAMEKSIQIATLSRETSEKCGYLVPKAGKRISGPSVHLARILAKNYGNMRVKKEVTREEDRFINASAIAWDLETNFAISATIRRRITDKHGRRYGDDMIQTAGLAAMAIAERTVILSVIDTEVIEKTYEATRRKITGDLTDEDKLVERRGKMFKHFLENHGVDEKAILKFFGYHSISQIKPEDIATLIHADNSLKTGEAKPETFFGDEVERGKAAELKKKLEEERAKKGSKDKKPEPDKQKEDNPEQTKKEGGGKINFNKPD